MLQNVTVTTHIEDMKAHTKVISQYKYTQWLNVFEFELICKPLSHFKHVFLLNIHH